MFVLKLLIEKGLLSDIAWYKYSFFIHKNLLLINLLVWKQPKYKMHFQNHLRRLKCYPDAFPCTAEWTLAAAAVRFATERPTGADFSNLDRGISDAIFPCNQLITARQLIMVSVVVCGTVDNAGGARGRPSIPFFKSSFFILLCFDFLIPHTFPTSLFAL